MKIMFWNTHKNAGINAILSELIIENDVSIAVLVEYAANLEDLIRSLSSANIKMNEFITAGCDRIKIIGNSNLKN